MYWFFLLSTLLYIWTDAQSLTQSTVEAPVIRAVNCGGWFVLEPWITPSLFDDANARLSPDKQGSIVDEWTFAEYLGPEVANSILARHWDTWITEDDFIKVSKAGINTLRLPVGYWMFDITADEPFSVAGSYNYLMRAFGWARKHNLKIMLDLHGAPGSQNGFDNSGRAGPSVWGAETGLPNIERTVKILKTLATNMTLSNSLDVLAAIEVLNEPRWDKPFAEVQKFYKRAYAIVREQIPVDSGVAITIHDSFRFNNWEGFMQESDGYYNVWLDTHIYQAFDHDLMAKNYSQHMEVACSWGETLSNSSKNLYTVVGEWSLGTTDCAKYLNGYKTGTRYEGTFGNNSKIGDCAPFNDLPSFTDEYKQYLADLASAQIRSYSSGNGWSFWTIKTENQHAPQWDFLLGLDEGWIPANVSAPIKLRDHCSEQKQLKDFKILASENIH